MNSPRIGELFSGYGGLGMGVQAALGGTIAWHSDIDKGACKILAHRYPDVSNIGDITTVDWSQVEPVDIITGGSPCQDLSHAGKRGGMTEGTRSNLWVSMREAIAQLRPALVVWENVRGAYSAAADSDVEPCAGCVGDRPGVSLRALHRVLGDLADLGYDASWHGLRAADVGAPHGRFRVFVVAHSGSQRLREHSREPSTEEARADAGNEPAGYRGLRPHQVERATARDPHQQRHERARSARGWRDGSADSNVTAPYAEGVDSPSRAAVARDRGARPSDGSGASPDTASNGRDEGWTEPARLVGRPDAAERGASAADAASARRDRSAGSDAQSYRRGERPSGPDADGRTDWGQYAAAIARWERVLGRPAPAPTEPGRTGQPRLSPRFVEWMMGLPDGWVVDVPELTRNEALKALGNGVVPQQAEAAIRFLLNVSEVAA